MIGAIPNPTKSIVIDFPIQSVKDSIVHVPTALKFTHFRESNEMFNTYTFARSEFLSFGALINVNLTEISENKTQINIEIARQLGAFDNWVEVQKANEHVTGFINALAHIIANGVSEMPNQGDGGAVTFLKVIGYGVLGLFLGVLILSIILNLMK
jgi:hypothetical protein